MVIRMPLPQETHTQEILLLETRIPLLLETVTHLQARTRAGMAVIMVTPATHPLAIMEILVIRTLALVILILICHQQRILLLGAIHMFCLQVKPEIITFQRALTLQTMPSSPPQEIIEFKDNLSDFLSHKIGIFKLVHECRQY